MNKHFLTLIFFLTVAGISHGQMIPNQKAFYKAPLFVLDSALWCAKVDDRGRPYLKLSKAKVGNPIFFWVKLRSDQKNALELLQKMENPVIIKWFRFSSYGTSPEWSNEPQQNEFVNIKKGTDVLQTKTKEFDQMGAFTYLIWGQLSTINSPGVYQVKLVFYDNSPLYCGNSPCEYRIKIEK